MHASKRGGGCSIKRFMMLGHQDVHTWQLHPLQVMSNPGQCPTRSREEYASCPHWGTDSGTWHQTTLHIAVTLSRVSQCTRCLTCSLLAKLATS